MTDVLLALVGIVVMFIISACQRAERAAMCAYLAARSPNWVPGMELRSVCGWGTIGSAHALVSDGLAEVEEFGTAEHRGRRGGRPAYRYRWKGSRP